MGAPRPMARKVADALQQAPSLPTLQTPNSVLQLTACNLGRAFGAPSVLQAAAEHSSFDFLLHRIATGDAAPAYCPLL